MSSRQHFRFRLYTACVSALLLYSGSVLQAAEAQPGKQDFLVGTQYDTTHVYVAPDKIDALVAGFIATFGGQATQRVTTNVLPVPSSTASQAIFTPVGNLSVFAFQTPVPFPFGQERNGYLVTDMDQAVKAAVKAGAAVLVQPFTDPIGRDAVIEWPGGVKMQFYWHFKASSSPALQSVPESRFYVSPDRVEAFVHDLIRFAQGKVVSDEPEINAAEIGRAGETYRRLRIESGFGKTAVYVTNGHLPYPFGYERTGYEVTDLEATLAKARAAGVQMLTERYDAGDRTTILVEFPGGYIAELHALKAH